MPGGNACRGTIGPRSAKVPVSVAASSATATAPSRCRAARRPDRAGSAAGRPPEPRAAPRQNPLRRKSARRRGWRRARANPRSPPAAPAHARPRHRRRAFTREQSGLGKAKRHRPPARSACGSARRAAGARTPPHRTDDAATACRRRGATAPASGRCRRTTLARCVETAGSRPVRGRLPSTTPKPPARNSRWRRATGSGPSSPTSNVDHRKMRRGIAVALERRHRIELSPQ